MLHFESKWGIYRMKCIIAIVKLAAELAFCGCYTTTSAPEYSRIFRKRWHFSHSDTRNPVSSQIHCCFRSAKHRKKTRKSAENRLKIGRKSAISRKNRNHSLHSLAFCGMLHWIWSAAVSTAPAVSPILTVWSTTTPWLFKTMTIYLLI